jgi:hypothetical protein
VLFLLLAAEIDSVQALRRARLALAKLADALESQANAHGVKAPTVSEIARWQVR